MGKQKQQVISRFFAPKSKPQESTSSAPPPPPPSSSSSSPPPKISATVNFSPAKRLRTSQLISSSPQAKPSKIPRFSLPYCTNSDTPCQDDRIPHAQLIKPFSQSPNVSPHTHNPIPPLPDPSVHERFLKKLLEPAPAFLEPSKHSATSGAKYTPLEQQVVELKVKYPDVLLMVEVGYRFRFFGEDAENAARVLGIYAHMDHNFLTASIPTFRLNVHVRRLVNAGYKVGVVKQTETAAIKAHGSNKLGPFCRGLSALYTRATLEAAEDLGGEEEGRGSCNNYLVCIVEKGMENVEGCSESEVEVKIGFVGVEISNGDVVYGEISDNFMRAGLEALLLHLSPAELLLGKPLTKHTEKFLHAYAGSASKVRIEHSSRDCFADGGALGVVISLFENMIEEDKLDESKLRKDEDAKAQYLSSSIIEGIMAMPDLAIQALILAIRHLKQFGFERILSLGASFRPFSTDTEMALSANTLQQLEVLKNNFDGSESGSLLQCMNHTLTASGSRLLRHWVTHPLCDRNMIHGRLDAVSEIIESMGSSVHACDFHIDQERSDVTIMQPEIHQILSSVLTSLGRSPDVQRGINRIYHRTSTACEFISVIQAILLAGKQLQQLFVEENESDVNMHTRQVRSSLLRKLIQTASSSSVISAGAKLLSVLNKEAAERKDLHNLFIISGKKIPEVSAAKTAVQLAKDKLELLISIYRKQLRVSHLEFMSVSSITHLIELPVDMKVPSNWIKVNSTKKTIRYHPPEVLTALDQLSLANEELTLACQASWDRFLKDFGGYYAEFHAAVQALAALDCLQSLATLSKNKNYVRPDFVNDEEPVQIQISAGRHPVMEMMLHDNFVPNDTYLHAEREYCQIVTGPNMGGKSCYIRQVALITIMAQIGSFVPASSAKLHVLDSIYTRMGASDSIQQGRSTFLEELGEASQMLLNCTSRSLVIIDELGRGTSTHDGVAIAYATLQYLLEHKRCMVLFVTHYPEIVGIRNEFPGSVGAYHVSYLASQRDAQLSSNSNLEVDKKYDDITYLYKLVPGVSERSFGFKVAQLAQLPLSCIDRAIVMASRLEAAVSKRKLIGDIEGLNEFSNACREFFSNLGFTISGKSDATEGLQRLKLAKMLAMELVNR